MDGAYVNKVEINVNNGGQVNIAEGNAVVAAVQNNCNGAKSIKQKIKSRTQEYADKWNDNMFLNNFDEWDENAGVNVKLSDVYIDDHLPHFIWGCNEGESKNLKNFLSKYVSKNKENKMLLILGQPGIGKSTLITWITAKFANKINDILVYRFASDLGDVNWQQGEISRRILEKLSLTLFDLCGKIVILDGFDEVSIENNRRDILDSLYADWIYDKKFYFTLIITCRENYIKDIEKAKCEYITLHPWDISQIKSFCSIFQKKTRSTILKKKAVWTLGENKEVLGIPLILYMVLALNIPIEKQESIVDVYDKIFALEGGIYDRCIDYKSFAEKHRVSEIKKQIHQISRDIALWIFENNPDDANIPQKEYHSICDSIAKISKQKNEDVKRDFLIGSFVQLKHCDGIETERVYFVHRSIYEYFVAETIYNSIETPLLNLSEEGQKELARNIVVYLKQGRIKYTIGRFLKYKIFKSYAKLDNQKKNNFYEWWEKAIDNMMTFGMFYSVRDIYNYKNLISKEVNCILNLIEILRLLMIVSHKKYILEYAKKERVERYIKYCIIEKGKIDLSYTSMAKFNLAGMIFNDMDLSRVNLEDAILFKASLVRTKLNESNLKGVNLYRANLQKVELRRAYLYKAILFEADLRDANLEEADLTESDLEGADLRGAKLSKVCFRTANLEASIWNECDINEYCIQLVDARFSSVFMERGNERRRIERCKVLSITV